MFLLIFFSLQRFFERSNSFLKETKENTQASSIKRWTTLFRTILPTLENQDAPPSKEQLNYLNRELFGGMGSLNDFYFKKENFGNQAKPLNDQLEAECGLLYKKLSKLRKNLLLKK
jgi:hypothetical protein